MKALKKKTDDSEKEGFIIQSEEIQNEKQKNVLCNDTDHTYEILILDLETDTMITCINISEKDRTTVENLLMAAGFFD